MELYVVLTQTSTQWCGYLIILQYVLAVNFLALSHVPPLGVSITGVGNEKPPALESFQLW